MSKSKDWEVLLSNSSYELTASQGNDGLTFQLQLRQDNSKFYQASFESINKFGKLVDYCENFQQVKEFFKEPSRVKIDEQKLMVSLNIKNPINNKKMVEIFTMKLQQPDKDRQGKKNECHKCAQQIGDLKNKVAKLEQSLLLIIEESKKEREQREQKQKFYSEHYISRQEFNSQTQKFKQLNAKELVAFRNSLEAPNMLQNQYQCSMVHEFLPEERAQSYALSQLSHQNDVDHRKSSFLRSTFLNSQDTFTQQSVHRLQQKLKFFTDKTEQQIQTLQINTANIQTQICQIGILASFNEAMLFESIHFSISQGYHNILALSIASQYSIKQTQHLIQNCTLPLFIEDNVQEEKQEEQNFFSPDQDMIQYGSCDFFSSQIQEQQEPAKYQQRAQKQAPKQAPKRAPKRASKR